MFDEDSLRKAIKKIISIFKEQSIDKITVQRKYLLEIFDADLLEISKNDGLPALKQIVLDYFEVRGIMTRFSDNVVQFETIVPEIFDYIDRFEEIEDDIRRLDALIQDAKMERKKKKAISKLHVELEEKHKQLRELEIKIVLLRLEKVELRQKLLKLNSKEGELLLMIELAKKLRIKQQELEKKIQESRTKN